MIFFKFIPVFALFAAPFLLALLAIKGYLSPRALDGAPNRRIGLCPCDRSMLTELIMTVIGAVALILIAQAVLGKLLGPLNQLGQMSIDKRMTVQLVLQLVSQGPFVVFLYFWAARQPNGLRKIGLLPRHFWHSIGVGLIGLLCALILVFATITIASIIGLFFNQHTPQLGHELLREISNHTSAVPVVLSILMAVVFAPVLEESIFRGLIQSSLVEMSSGRHRWLAVFIASAIFMGAHLGGEVTWQALPGLFVLGIILGWVYERTGSIWASITIHGGFNLYNMLITIFIISRHT